MTNEPGCLRALREAADRLGESPTKAQYEALDVTPSSSTILRHCGGWNAAKERAGLETNASRGSRIQPKPDDVDLPTGLNWDELSQDQRWYYKNREWNTQRTLHRRQRLRAWLRDVKRERGGCRQCGESDPACLDFHHCEENAKEMAVNEMVPMGCSKGDIRAEVEQCDLLCANCHWVAHNPEPAGIEAVDDIADDGRNTKTDLSDPDRFDLTKAERLRAWTYAYQRDRACRDCEETDPRCLQFHHVEGTKRESVGTMIADGWPVKDVLDEVEKCVVLCANCHRREHDDPPAVGESDSV
jgi:hypothetical protein